jgi:hypothetical protein
MLAARSSLEPVGDARVKGEDVRFGSKADIREGFTDVRFTPESGHSPRHTKCPLSAKSGHWRHEPDSLADLIQLHIQAGANTLLRVYGSVSPAERNCSAAVQPDGFLADSDHHSPCLS